MDRGIWRLCAVNSLVSICGVPEKRCAGIEGPVGANQQLAQQVVTAFIFIENSADACVEAW